MLQFIERSTTLGRNVPETGTAARSGPQTPEKAENEICETVINSTVLSPTVLHFTDARPKRPETLVNFRRFCRQFYVFANERFAKTP